MTRYIGIVQSDHPIHCRRRPCHNPISTHTHRRRLPRARWGLYRCTLHSSTQRPSGCTSQLHECLAWHCSFFEDSMAPTGRHGTRAIEAGGVARSGTSWATLASSPPSHTRLGALRRRANPARGRASFRRRRTPPPSCPPRRCCKWMRVPSTLQTTALASGDGPRRIAPESRTPGPFGAPTASCSCSTRP